jgi:hypothetical protein
MRHDELHPRFILLSDEEMVFRIRSAGLPIPPRLQARYQMTAETERCAGVACGGHDRLMSRLIAQQEVYRCTNSTKCISHRFENSAVGRAKRLKAVPGKSRTSRRKDNTLP